MTLSQEKLEFKKEIQSAAHTLEELKVNAITEIAWQLKKLNEKKLK